MILDSMRWSEELSSADNGGGSSSSNNNSGMHHHHSNSNAGAPTIKNHSVTHFHGNLFCFGGYDGRRNHMTLLIYNIAEKRWIRPHHHVAGAMMGQPQQQQQQQQQQAVDNEQQQQQQQQQHGGGVVGNVGGGGGGGGGGFLGDPSYLVQGTPPPGRNGHSATLAPDTHGDDNENGRIIIIGGWLGTGPLAASDMHILDVSAGGRQLRWYQPAVKGTPPGPCNMHSADYVPQQRSVYVFRGGNGREYLNDLHALNVDTLTWKRLETTGAIPQQRANHSSAMLEETGELFIFGGWNGGERLNDIHILDTETSNWTCPRVGGVLPHPRAGMTLTALRGRLYLFGGSGTSAKCFQDLQILDRQEMAWLDVSQYDSNNNNNTGRHHHHHHHYREFGGGNHEDDHRIRFGGGNNNNNNNNNMIFDSHSSSSSAFSQEHDAGGQVHDYGGEEQDAMQQGGTQEGCNNMSRNNNMSFTSLRADWRSRDNMAIRPLNHHHAHAQPNPNDEDTVPTVLVHGRGPGRRAGHTATAVNRKIYVFGGSCGSDYLNDFYVLDTDPAPQAIVSEPTSLELLERRLRHFFNDEEFSDVTFVVQGRRVYGHKMILSIVSDCFRAMFTTGFRESDAMEIEIPDCSYAAFYAVMEYIYTGAIPKMDLMMMMTTTTNGNNNNNDQDRNLGRVVEMLELADRFFLDHLKQICETMLQPTVNAETVEYLLGVAQKTNASQLEAICEHFLRNREGGV